MWVNIVEFGFRGICGPVCGFLLELDRLFTESLSRFAVICFNGEDREGIVGAKLGRLERLCP